METTQESQQSQKILDVLPEEVRNHPVMSRFADKGPEDLAKSYIELTRWQSGAVKIPTKDSPKEDWDALPEKFAKNGVHLAPVPDWEDEDQVAAFRKAIGVPDDPGEYDPDELPEDAQGRPCCQHHPGHERDHRLHPFCLDKVE